MKNPKNKSLKKHGRDCLKKISIRNFQAHKKKIIKVDPHVTIIVGRNDSGKSAIVRAIKFAALGGGSKRRIIHRGSKRASVGLRLGKHEVKRKIGKGGSGYALGSKHYRAFRTKVPEAIRNILHLDKINFQSQHEALFWFGLSPGKIAKELNKIVDLESIDQAQDIVAKRLRKKKFETEEASQRLEEIQAKINGLSWLPPLDVKMGKLISAADRYATKSHQTARIALLVNSGLEADNHRRAATVGLAEAATGAVAGRESTRLAGRLDRLAGLLDGGKLATIRQTRLEKILHELRDVEASLKKLNSRLSKKQTILEKKLGGRCYTCGAILTERSLI